jgi:DNA-binding transcriptional regulator GbsR (MarR family)
MNLQDHPEPERAFVEHLALLLEASGLPRIYGRVLGRLLVCDPPEQSLSQLADWLDASKGAVSPATRALARMGLVREVPRPGRGTWYRIEKDAWVEAMRLDLERLRALRLIADEGLLLLKDAPPERSARLRELRDLNAWFEARMPALIDEWIRQRGTP